MKRKLPQDAQATSHMPHTQQPAQAAAAGLHAARSTDSSSDDDGASNEKSSSDEAGSHNSSNSIGSEQSDDEDEADDTASGVFEGIKGVGLRNSRSNVSSLTAAESSEAHHVVSKPIC